MSRGASPFTVNGPTDGEADAARDNALLGTCPPGEPVGKDPAKAWSVRYSNAYDAAFKAQRHQCTDKCRERTGAK